MSDNKVNMSLDDIIKSERKNKKVKGPNGKKRGIRNVTRGKNVHTRRGKRNNIKLNAATVKAVNRLVKKAISQRSTQQLIRRAVTRRAVATRRNLAIRSAGFRTRRSFHFNSPSLSNRLHGLNQRSRIIRRGVARRLVQQEPIILANNIKNIRGRGTARLGRLVSDETPVYFKREIVPVIDEATIEEVPRQFQYSRRRQVVLQQRRRPNVAQRRLDSRPVVTYLSPRNNRIISKRTRFITRSMEPVFERVKPAKRVFVNPNVSQMREALGIGKRAERVVERFEPSSSFLQRVPVTRRKGRGFQERY